MVKTDLLKVFEINEEFKNEEFKFLSNLIFFNCDLISFFTDSYNSWLNKLSYHFNLIDELHANENSHSRILVKLLKYAKNGKYPILQSFIDYFSANSENFKFTHIINNPQITPEKHRIDALVVDNDYAIIIENKIHNAKDQDEQLIRYVKKLNNLKQLDENIYIIYLSRWRSSPSQESFPDLYKSKFQNRYTELSYRYDIIPWLQSRDLQNYISQEEYLSGALHQYLDHLKGIFHLRKIDKTMNDDLINLLGNQLGLKTNPIENIKIIDKTLKDFAKTKEYLENLLKINWFKTWEEKLKSDFNDYKIFADYNDLSDYPKVGIVFEYDKIKFSLLIEMELNLYYGIGIHNATNEFDPAAKKYLNNVVEGYKEELPGWYGWKYTSWENAYADFKKLADKIITKLNC